MRARTALWLRKNWLWLAANLAATVPALWLVWDIQQGNLSVNPIDDLTDRTGKAALVLLILSLACTPANILLGWRQPLALRRSLGLWSFAYAGVHLLNFVGLDYGFNLGLILRDGLPTKPYILVGLAALLMLLPLAITSTNGWKVRLGKRWKTLHRLAYVAAGAAVVHFLWLAKAAEDFEPLLYGTALGLLLLVRVPPIRRRIVAFRQRRAPAPARPAPRPAVARTQTGND